MRAGVCLYVCVCVCVCVLCVCALSWRRVCWPDTATTTPSSLASTTPSCQLRTQGVFQLLARQCPHIGPSDLFVCFCACLFVSVLVCFIASQHTLPQLMLQRYTPTVYDVVVPHHAAECLVLVLHSVPTQGRRGDAPRVGSRRQLVDRVQSGIRCLGPHKRL